MFDKQGERAGISGNAIKPSGHILRNQRERMRLSFK